MSNIRKFITELEELDDSDLDETQTREWIQEISPEVTHQRTNRSNVGSTVQDRRTPTDASNSNASVPRDKPQREWMLPFGVDPDNMFGKGNSVLVAIGVQTNTYLTPEVTSNRETSTARSVYIWGLPEHIDEAVLSLETHASHVYNASQLTKPRTKGWARPERAYSDRKIRKEDVRIKKRGYSGAPPRDARHEGTFMLPAGFKKWPLWLVRADDSDFLKIKEDSRCWVVHETNDEGGFLRVISDNAANIGVCLSRIENIFIQRVVPKKHYEINLLACPSSGPQTRAKFVRSFEFSNSYLGLRSDALVMKLVRPKDDDEKEYDGGSNSDDSENERITGSNGVKLSRSFCLALTDLRLWEGKIRVSVKFGRVVVTDYPDTTKYPSWTVEALDAKVFPHKAFKTRFIPCVAKEISKTEKIIRLFRAKYAEVANSPRDSYEVYCCNRVLPATNGTEPAEEDNEIRPKNAKYLIKARFREQDGALTFWDAEDLLKPTLNLTYHDLDSPIDWKFNIDIFTSLPTDNETNYGEIAQDLRVGAQTEQNTVEDVNNGRLFYRNTHEIVVTAVNRLRTWIFASDEWNVHIRREDQWVLDVPKDPIYMPIPSTPLRSSVSVQAFNRSLDEALATNRDVGPGEPALWNTEELAGVKPCHKIIEELHEIQTIITQSLE